MCTQQAGKDKVEQENRMRKIPSVKQVMTPFPYWIDADRPVAEAHALMRENAIRHVPVKENESLIGVLSDRDIMLTLDPELGYAPDRSLNVADVCSREIFVVDLSERLDRVAEEMAERKIGSALVTKDDKLVGVFTATDACRCLAEFLREEFFHPPGDEAA